MILAGLVGAAIIGGCTQQRRGVGAAALGPPAATRQVAPLGNLRIGTPPTAREVELARFFFGAAPEASLGLIKPVDVVATADRLYVSDSARQGVFSLSIAARELHAADLSSPPAAPNTLAHCDDGGLIVADLHGDAIRYDAAGRIVHRYAGPPGMRAGGAVEVGDEVWVTNVTAHRIEVFDARSATQQRSIGRRGRGAGEFGLPLGLARTPDGDVCVVDLLNARVQVLDARGNWVRDIGGAGDRPGYMGRPKDVAVGPDGIVFVTDAAAQCVHAFRPDGRIVTSFGGAADGSMALVLPNGIAISSVAPDASYPLPADFKPVYYVLVAEQMVDPGIRVYAWSGEVHPFPGGRPMHAAAVAAQNPHWRPDRCGTCHTMNGAIAEPIARDAIDAKCISCHDGDQAIQEAHPVGWPAAGPRTQAPPDWPLLEGRITCLTCHDVRRHCDQTAQRPAENPALVRGHDPRNPMASCAPCHTEASWRLNPHVNQISGFAMGTTACAFCHTGPPHERPDGGWTFDPSLREKPPALCLNCHTMHADPAPQGHLGAAVAPEMFARIAKNQGARATAIGAEGASLLPLTDGRVTCATCHNPHPPSPTQAEVFTNPHWNARSTAPVDEGKALRVEHMQLCSYCHGK